MDQTYWLTLIGNLGFPIFVSHRGAIHFHSRDGPGRQRMEEGSIEGGPEEKLWKSLISMAFLYE